jgi:putative membrane protein
VPIFWHVPRYHNLSVLNDPVHYAMHLTMLLPALVFFWRVLDPRPAPLGASFATRVVMCWAAIAGTVPLGASLSLKRTALYDSYERNGRIWDLGALQDELLGGFIVWMPGSMMFVVLLLVVIRLWGARESRMDALRQRGIVRPEPLDLRRRNRALATRLAGIAATVAGGVVAIVLLSRLLP